VAVELATGVNEFVPVELPAVVVELLVLPFEPDTSMLVDPSGIVAAAPKPEGMIRLERTVNVGRNLVEARAIAMDCPQLD
jgi:hypothetical protein